MTQHKKLKCPDCGKTRKAPAYGNQTLLKRCDNCREQTIEISKKTAQKAASVLNRAIKFNTMINTFESDKAALQELKKQLKR